MWLPLVSYNGKISAVPFEIKSIGIFKCPDLNNYSLRLSLVVPAFRLPAVSPSSVQKVFLGWDVTRHERVQGLVALLVLDVRVLPKGDQAVRAGGGKGGLVQGHGDLDGAGVGEQIGDADDEAGRVAVAAAGPCG